MSGPRLDGFHCVVSVPVAWGDMDALGHVNNALYFRYMETARLAYMHACGWDVVAEPRVVYVLAHVEARFRRPVVFPDTLRIGSRPLELGEDRVLLEHRFLSRSLGEPCTTGRSLVVAFDRAAGRKAALPPRVRERLQAHLGAGGGDAVTEPS